MADQTPQTPRPALPLSMSADSPPPLAALFVIKFDLKIGYTISWKRSSSSNVPLDGVVEFKSLPSGLHNIKRDLVYFTHERWAGVSAFRNTEASQGERGARFLSVGALVNLGDGRLGRVWEHARAMVELSEKVAEEPEKLDVLEEYWETHFASGEDDEGDEDESDPASPYTAAQRRHRNRNRAMSSLTLLAPSSKDVLPEYHPAHSILGYLDCFGPLAFPLHRLALLRKRILICASPPVKGVCEFVFDLSIFSSLPHSLSYASATPSLNRLRPLFNMGIHDIPYLTDLSKSKVSDEDSDTSKANGWIACTTDEILAMKPQLYDILVELPHSPSSKRAAGPGRRPKNKGVGFNRWPTLKHAATGQEIKATQRDLRRYRSLRRALAPLTSLDPQPRTSEEDLDEPEDDNEETHLLFSSMHGNFADSGEEEIHRRHDEEKVTEPMSWSELAYGGFMWWASAGEREEGLKTEDEMDAQLLGQLPEAVQREVRRRKYRDEDEDGEEEEEEQAARNAEIEMSLIGYFHRVSKAVFEAVDSVFTERGAGTHEHEYEQGDSGDEDAVDDDDGQHDGEEQEEEEDGVIKLESEDLRRCGLDLWSEQDRRFIIELVDLWFGREVKVRRVSIECCGIRLI